MLRLLRKCNEGEGEVDIKGRGAEGRVGVGGGGRGETRRRNRRRRGGKKAVIEEGRECDGCNMKENDECDV